MLVCFLYDLLVVKSCVCFVIVLCRLLLCVVVAFCQDLLLKTPCQSASHNVAPMVYNQSLFGRTKRICKTWLSLVKLVSVEVFQKESLDVGKTAQSTLG